MKVNIEPEDSIDVKDRARSAMRRLVDSIVKESIVKCSRQDGIERAHDVLGLKPMGPLINWAEHPPQSRKIWLSGVTSLQDVYEVAECVIKSTPALGRLVRAVARYPGIPQVSERRAIRLDGLLRRRGMPEGWACIGNMNDRMSYTTVITVVSQYEEEEDASEALMEIFGALDSLDELMGLF
jgi:hypothetical protein